MKTVRIVEYRYWVPISRLCATKKKSTLPGFDPGTPHASGEYSTHQAMGTTLVRSKFPLFDLLTSNLYLYMVSKRSTALWDQKELSNSAYPITKYFDLFTSFGLPPQLMKIRLPWTPVDRASPSRHHGTLYPVPFIRRHRGTLS